MKYLIFEVKSYVFKSLKDFAHNRQIYKIQEH